MNFEISFALDLVFSWKWLFHPCPPRKSYKRLLGSCIVEGCAPLSDHSGLNTFICHCQTLVKSASSNVRQMSFSTPAYQGMSVRAKARSWIGPLHPQSQSSFIFNFLSPEAANKTDPDYSVMSEIGWGRCVHGWHHASASHQSLLGCWDIGILMALCAYYG